ncbi:hypothetical protein K491DRAFT_431912 [Lophiostoma macrostomum CBS 122681]|uniref:Uncharacterized protein n=1 Tax=Lophiostoma macrostomum CBS 122681 TaxID=1314788 RepID=A0A6A6T5G5_9PLEO|nr:hypothetical protein K491DRAFT_431912 [Lophiostoma macrostomum CBS 122681]
MSDNPSLMDTEPGGEQTQYEGEHTHVEPHANEAGQLGDPSTHTTTSDSQAPRASNTPNTQGVTPAEKIRYGQSIQEGGMGGQTTSSTGEAKTEGGFGGTGKLGQDGEEEDEAAKSRREQGYGGEGDMDRGIGA